MNRFPPENQTGHASVDPPVLAGEPRGQKTRERRAGALRIIAFIAGVCALFAALQWVLANPAPIQRLKAVHDACLAVDHAGILAAAESFWSTQDEWFFTLSKESRGHIVQAMVHLDKIAGILEKPAPGGDSERVWRNHHLRQAQRHLFLAVKLIEGGN